MKKDNDKYNKIVKKPSFIFSRSFICFVILLIEVSAIVTLMVIFNQSHVAIFAVSETIAIIGALFVINDKSDPSYKITWLFFLTVFSLLGVVFYFLFANKKFTKKEKMKTAQVRNELQKGMNSRLSDAMTERIDIDKEPDAYNISHYIKNAAGIDIFRDTHVDYYAWGDDAFQPMLDALKSAKHYIFMEYFIIDHGKFWNSILEILMQKAKEGVDVRVIYDDLGCMTTLHSKYYLYLRDNGIKAYKYSPIKPVLDIRMNNRDHRKILVVDGYIGFTGGINIADEYINEIVRFGKWKDNAIRLEGDGVFGLTALFLATWTSITKEKEDVNYVDYLPIRHNLNIEKIKVRNGFVQPYGSLPYNYETVGAKVYIDMLMRAKKYVYISTPYLILNKEMENAICQACKNGAKVKLLTPHIPDKKMVFQLTRSFYKPLIEAGVEIYEFTPGFVHAKTFVVDGEMATVGTINLDYRSLFLHCENGAFLYKVDCIKDIEKDFENTFMVSMPYTKEMVDKTKWYTRGFRAILRVFAPLM